MEEELLDQEELDNEEEIDSLESEVSQEERVEEQEVEKAKKFGHLSKEDWEAQGKDPELWKSPEDFNETGEIIGQIRSMKKRLDQRDNQIKSLVDYQTRTSQREYGRAKQELEGQLAASKDDMDMDKVSHYTKELTNLENTENNSQEQLIQQQRQEALTDFTERNQHWFNDRNPDLIQRATSIDNELKEIYPNASFEDLATKIETRMKYEFPDRMGGQETPRPPTISPSRSSVNKTAVNKSTPNREFQKLSQELKDVYNATKMTRKSIAGEDYPISEFIERLKKDGEI